MFEPGEKGGWMAKLLHNKTGRIQQPAKCLEHGDVVVEEPDTIAGGSAHRRAFGVQICSREGSAVRLDDAARNGEPHSSPLRFCGKECLEKLLAHPTGKTRTRITHADENVSVSITARMNGKASRIGRHSSHCFK